MCICNIYIYIYMCISVIYSTYIRSLFWSSCRILVIYLKLLSGAIYYLQLSSCNIGLFGVSGPSFQGQSGWKQDMKSRRQSVPLPNRLLPQSRNLTSWKKSHKSSYDLARLEIKRFQVLWPLRVIKICWHRDDSVGDGMPQMCLAMRKNLSAVTHPLHHRTKGKSWILFCPHDSTSAVSFIFWRTKASNSLARTGFVWGFLADCQNCSNAWKNEVVHCQPYVLLPWMIAYKSVSTISTVSCTY